MPNHPAQSTKCHVQLLKLTMAETGDMQDRCHQPGSDGDIQVLAEKISHSTSVTYTCCCSRAPTLCSRVLIQQLEAGVAHPEGDSVSHPQLSHLLQPPLPSCPASTELAVHRHLQSPAQTALPCLHTHKWHFWGIPVTCCHQVGVKTSVCFVCLGLRWCA